MSFKTEIAEPPGPTYKGRPSKYPFDQMPVGGDLCFLIPLEDMPGSGLRGVRAAAFARGYHIRSERTEEGFRIWVTGKR